MIFIDFVDYIDYLDYIDYIDYIDFYIDYIEIELQWFTFSTNSGHGSKRQVTDTSRSFFKAKSLYTSLHNCTMQKALPSSFPLARTTMSMPRWRNVAQLQVFCGLQPELQLWRLTGYRRIWIYIYIHICTYIIYVYLYIYIHMNSN